MPLAPKSGGGWGAGTLWDTGLSGLTSLLGLGCIQWCQKLVSESRPKWFFHSRRAPQGGLWPSATRSRTHAGAAWVCAAVCAERKSPHYNLPFLPIIFLYSLNSLRLYFCTRSSFTFFSPLMHTEIISHIIYSDFFLYFRYNPFKWWRKSKTNGNNIMPDKFGSWELKDSIKEKILKEDRWWTIKRKFNQFRSCKHTMIPLIKKTKVP